MSYLINGSILGTAFTNFWFNATAADPGKYTIQVWTYNTTGGYNTNLTVEVNDTTMPPNVTGIVSPTAGNNYSGSSLLVNVSINDSWGSIASVVFMLVNGTNGSMITNYTASNSGFDYWNATINISNHANETHNITIYARDNSGNVNKTVMINKIIFDNVKPSSISLASSSSTRTSLTISITAEDGLSGITSCSADRGDASITGSGGSYTMTETGLTCSTSYQYIVTCTDSAGNTESSGATPFSTASCSSSVVGGSTPKAWTMTYKPSNEQINTGYTKSLSAKHKVEFTVSSETHYVGIKSLTASSATVEFASDPIEVVLDIGEDAKVDVTDDGFYDIYVILNAISNNKADVLVQGINEEIPIIEGEEPSSIDTSGDVIEPEEAPAPISEPESNLTWLWVVLGIIVIAGVALIVHALRCKNCGVCADHAGMSSSPAKKATKKKKK